MKATVPSVYVVDDSAVTLEAITHDLEQSLGCRVVGFSSAEECLRMIDEKPDIIVADYILDADYSYKMNGDQMLYMIRQQYPKLPVIMYSSQHKQALSRRLLQLGATDFMPKERDYITGLRKRVMYEIKKQRDTNREKSAERSVMFACCVFIAILLIMRAFFPDGLALTIVLLLVTGAILLFRFDSRVDKNDKQK